MTERTSISRKEKFLMVLLLSILAFYFNRAFMAHCSYQELILTNDVEPILNGYKLAPHLFPDSLRWWHGSWIQVGIPAFRPLTGYLYWTDCWLGMHYGFIYAAWLGLALLVVNCLLASALAWRFTGSKLLMVGTGILATMVHIYNVPMSADWLKWFPGHQELFMNAFLLGALICFDVAHSDDRPRYYIYSYCLFIVGCLAKEYVYIFPAMALSLMMARRPASPKAALRGWLWCGATFLFVACLWFYRKAIISHPRNPEISGVRQLWVKPLCFMYVPFYRYCAAKNGDIWFVGVVLIIFCFAGFYIKFLRHPLSRSAWGRWLRGRFYVTAAVAIALICAFVQATGHSSFELFWWLFEPNGITKRAQPTDMLDMLLIFYYTYLFWKYRAEEPTAAIWLLLLLAYTPVITYIGWHYTLPAWFVQSAYLCVIAKVMWIDWGRPLEKYLTRPGIDETPEALKGQDLMVQANAVGL